MENLVGLYCEDDIDKAVEVYESKFIPVLEKYCPVKSVEIKKKYTPLMTDEIRKEHKKLAEHQKAV